MYKWFSKHWKDLNIAISVWTFIISISVLAFSALQFIKVRIEEQEKVRFRTYHDILASASGAATTGETKLVSQRAYIYELRNFKEYSDLTIRLLDSLKEDWSKNLNSLSKNDQLKVSQVLFELEETKEYLTRR